MKGVASYIDWHEPGRALGVVLASDVVDIALYFVDVSSTMP